MDAITGSCERIANTAKSYKNPLIIKTLKMFGDVLHGSIIVRHFRALHPNRPIIWAISDRYLDPFKYYPYATTMVGLPHSMTLEHRQELGKRLRATYGANVVLPCVGPFGWKTAGSIVDQFLNNAKVKRLAVARKPILPIGDEDRKWADDFMKQHGLKDQAFMCMEYNSHSFKRKPEGPIWTISEYNDFLSQLKHPVVYLAHAGAERLKYGIDGRSSSWRQASALIRRAKGFLGCGSGLTMVSATEGVNTPILELNIGRSITMAGCGYKNSTALASQTPKTMIKNITDFMNGKPISQQPKLGSGRLPVVQARNRTLRSSRLRGR
jgi:hypothetical protein